VLVKNRTVTGLAALALASGACLTAGVSVAHASTAARAATVKCGSNCASLFNERFGSADVSAVTGSSAVGGPVALAKAAAVPAQDFAIYDLGHVHNFYRLGLINSTSGLILPYITLQLAISILIMRSMFQLVPHEMFESARIDGAGHWRALWEIGLPMVRNGLVVVFIVNFVAAWGEYLWCLTLVDDEAKRTMPVVLAAAQGGQGQWAWPNLAAVYVIVVTPGIIAFTLAQRLFFKGLMEGALKG